MTESVESSTYETPTGAKIGRIRINRPHKLNTVDRVTLQGLSAALHALRDQHGVRAVILAGVGDKAFIGGANIEEMAGLTPHTARGFIGLIHDVCTAIRDLPVPVIARLAGFTLGAGMEIAAACDLRVATQSARFGMPEVKLGIPSVVEAALLPGLIGWGRTRQILLLGEVFGTAEAQAWGFVQRVVADDALDTAIDEWIGAILAAGERAVGVQKRLIRRWEDLSVSQAIAAGVDAFAQAWETDEPAAAMAAWLAARAK
jgi:enoyl-CoA hydratase/carnithine racemase